jgi:transcriptional regulator with XRE-family HTH domain
MGNSLRHNCFEVIAMYQRIRNMREDRDLTQDQIAKYLSIHQTTYSDYELGNLNIPIPVLDKLAYLFETSIDYLVNRTDEKSPYPSKK